MKMVIPYHRSGLNPAIAKMTKVTLFNDYTLYQNAKRIEAAAKDSQTLAFKKQAAQKKDGESWPDYYRRWSDLAKDTGLSVKAETEFEFYEDLIETEDPVQTSRNYVEYCQENGIIPKFPQFVYNEDGSFNEQYYKVLADFSLYDADGEYSPQQVVRWGKDVLPENWQDLLLKALRAQQFTEDRLNTEIDSVVRDVLKAIGQDGGKGKTDGKKQFSLRSVDPVYPTNEKWERGWAFDEIKKDHPTLFALDADESEKRNPTQIKGTVSTYRKIYSMLEAEGFSGKILDASSGLGYGTKAGIEEFGFEVDDIEPFPDASYSPKYTDYLKLHDQYDVIISNAVLNVLPQDLRDDLVVKMGELLAPGGRLFINVRGRNFADTIMKNPKTVELDRENYEYFLGQTGSYQKGFTVSELSAYIQDALGPDFSVVPAKKSQFGDTAVIVTKKSEGKKQFSLREYDNQDNQIESLSASEIIPVNQVSDPQKFDYLAKEFSANGWNGRPIVVVKDGETYYAVTGSHRIFAAQDAGIDVEAVVLEYNEFLQELLDAYDDAERAYIAKNLLNEGEISEYAANLIIREESLNNQNYNVPYEKQLRYQIRQGGSPVEAENARLRRQVELLKEEFKLTDGHKMNKNAVNVLAGRLLRQYSSGYDRDLLESRLYEFFNSIANDSESSWFSFMDGATEIMTDVLDQSSRKEPSMRKQDPLYEELYQMLSAPITLRPDEYRSITAAFGKPERGKILGLRVKKGDETTPSLDVLHSTELIERFRGFFSHDQATAEDIFLRMAEVREAVNETTVVNDYGQDMEMASRMAAEALFEDYLNVPEKTTMADKNRAKVMRLRAEFKASRKSALESQKAAYTDRIRKIREELKKQRQKTAQVQKEAERKIDKAYDFGVADQRLADDIYFAGKMARAQSRMQRK